MRKVVSLLIFFCIACNVAKPAKNKVVAEPVVTKSSGARDGMSSGPGTCMIKGVITEILPLSGLDTVSLCGKNPCKAKVKVLEVYECGSSVTITLIVGKIEEMDFAFTLNNTTSLLPGLKPAMPGLKVGDTFTANAQQRLKPGGDGEFVIFHYDPIASR